MQLHILSKPSFVLTRSNNTPVLVAIVSLVFYLAVTLVTLFLNNWDARHFAHVSLDFLNSSNTSQIIKRDPSYDYGQVSYDGQFAYFIALDPVNATHYVDIDTYRYSRIGYPMLGRLLAFGIPALVPLTLVLVNILAVIITTWLLAKWCLLHKFSPWLALGYTFHIGLLLAFFHDLTEPLAYCLVAFGVVLFRVNRKVFWAALCFGLAGITREVSLIFGLGYCLALLLEEKSGFWPRLFKTLLFGMLVIGPYALWSIFLRIWLGSWSFQSGPGSFEIIPFAGYLGQFKAQAFQVIIGLIVIMPSMLLLFIALKSLWSGNRQIEIIILILNILMLVVFLPTLSYVDLLAAGRINLGVVLAAIISLPYLNNRQEVERNLSQQDVGENQKIRPMPRWYGVCLLAWCTYTLIMLISNPIAPYGPAHIL